jgi:hypothetical protein
VKDPEPPVITLTATSTSIEYLGTVTINWSAINATGCICDFGGGTGIAGAFTSPPLTKTTGFTVTATGPGGTIQSTITVVVGAAPQPTLKVTLDRDTIPKGQTVNMLIESKNAISILIKGVTTGNTAEQTVPVTTEKSFPALNGTFTTWVILETTNFTVTATGYEGLTITVVSPPVVIPTYIDTICGRYWKRFETKIFSKDVWKNVVLDEDQLRWQIFFYKKSRKFEVIDPKDNRVVGLDDFSINRESLTMGTVTYGYQLTDTTLTRVEYKITGEVVYNFYRGHKI